MKIVSIALYSFNELAEFAKEKAAAQHHEFLLSIMPEELEDGNGEAWPTTLSTSEVIDNIRANDYLFFADGTLAHCTTYTGKHPKAGTTEFYFHGQTLTLK